MEDSIFSSRKERLTKAMSLELRGRSTAAMARTNIGLLMLVVLVLALTI